ncbi:MAG TPA: thymidine phosphorylase [Candidatus Cloacimonadota bacterium]|nr:thymidine phosphorylase [Candidatus Cloacimonadota bacterium]HPT71140.1 thymidine phosphorylase [Candidatus Cloacimonadota bacterium]
MKNPVELILAKRDGKVIPAEEIRFFINDYLSGKIPEYQMGAMLMAIFFKGMEPEEIFALTDIYIHSGKTIKFPEGMQTTDKHSTGGIGDKISLMLAPIVAACGVPIPMISGRGLGHTGGTLDKLEAIPGFRTDFNDEEFIHMVNEIGFSIISQSSELVPADKRIYALRDVTGTVESLPLITASIMSKKIAEGARNLVIDLKVGTGAFMDTMDKAQALAKMLVATGEKFGQRVAVVFSNMNSPIGEYAGNGLEVLETVEYLKGKNIPDVDVITRALATEMLILAGKANTRKECKALIDDVLFSGKALDYFRKFVKAQGGNPAICEDTSLLPKAPHELPIIAQQDGWVYGIDCRKIGYALVDIGAGRKKLDDRLDYGAGAYLPVKIGDQVRKGESIGSVYCSDMEKGKMTVEQIWQSYTVSASLVDKPPVILDLWNRWSQEQ